MTDFYVDFSGAAGNGSFATPWNRLASITGAVSGDTVWCRRVTYTDTALTLALGTAIPHNVPIVGWPLVSDTRYAARPVAARSAWDGDAGTYAEIVHSPSTNTFSTQHHATSLSVLNSVTYILARLRIARTGIANSEHQGVLGLRARTNLGTVTCALVTESCSFEMTRNTATGRVFVLGHLDDNQGNTKLNLSWTDTSSILIVNGTADGVIHYDDYSSGASYLYLNCSLLRTVLRVTSSSPYMFSASSASNYSSVHGTFDSCTFDHTVARSTTNIFPWAIPALQPRIFSRCIWQVAAGSANGFNRFLVGLSIFHQCDFININSIQCNTTGGKLDIRRFLQGTADTGQAALALTVGAVVTAGYVRFTAGNVLDIDCGSSANEGIGGSTALIRSVDEGTGGYAIRYNGRVLLQDINGNVGSLKRTTVAGTAQSSAGYRSGGARFAYQLTPSAGPAAAAEGCPTCEPGFDRVLIGLLPGTRVITVYCLHVGYGVAPTAAEVWLDVEVPTTTQRILYSSRNYDGPALTADTSNWNGVSGTLTKFALSVTVPIDLECVASVRVYAGKTGGSVFVDPKPMVT